MTTPTNTTAVETMRTAIGQLLNEFGERQWQSGRGIPHQSLEDAFEAIIERAALTEQAPAQAGEYPEPSSTAGMNIAQRIAHVGGRNPPGSTYIEFGSIQAVEALVRQVLRDQPARGVAQAAEPLVGFFAAACNALTDRDPLWQERAELLEQIKRMESNLEGMRQHKRTAP